MSLTVPTAMVATLMGERFLGVVARGNSSRVQNVVGKFSDPLGKAIHWFLRDDSCGKFLHPFFDRPISLKDASKEPLETSLLKDFCESFFREWIEKKSVGSRIQAEEKESVLALLDQLIVICSIQRDDNRSHAFQKLKEQLITDDVVSQEVYNLFINTPSFAPSSSQVTPADTFLSMPGKTNATGFIQTTHGPLPIRLSSLIAETDLGAVYLGWQYELDPSGSLKATRPVVIKFILSDKDLLKGEWGCQSDLARTGGRVPFPILQDVTEDKKRFMVMEYVDGLTLESLKKTMAAWCELFPEDLKVRDSAVWTLALNVAGGIAHSHAHSIIHRDLKPANIMLTNGSLRKNVKILDWGLALRITKGEPISLHDNVFSGTLNYTAPECLQNQCSATFGNDVYALSATLLEMVLGIDLFPLPNESATTPQEILKQTLEGRRKFYENDQSLLKDHLAPLPEKVRRVFLKGLSWGKEDRHVDVVHFLYDLLSAFDNSDSEKERLDYLLDLQRIIQSEFEEIPELVPYLKEDIKKTIYKLAVLSRNEGDMEAFRRYRTMLLNDATNLQTIPIRISLSQELPSGVQVYVIPLTRDARGKIVPGKEFIVDPSKAFDFPADALGATLFFKAHDRPAFHPLTVNVLKLSLMNGAYQAVVPLATQVLPGFVLIPPRDSSMRLVAVRDKVTNEEYLKYLERMAVLSDPEMARSLVPPHWPRKFHEAFEYICNHRIDKKAYLEDEGHHELSWKSEGGRATEWIGRDGRIIHPMSPVTGVSAQNATKWAKYVYGDKARLTTRKEIEELALMGSFLFPWGSRRVPHSDNQSLKQDIMRGSFGLASGSTRSPRIPLQEGLELDRSGYSVFNDTGLITGIHGMISGVMTLCLDPYKVPPPPRADGLVRSGIAYVIGHSFESAIPDEPDFSGRELDLCDVDEMAGFYVALTYE